MKGYNMPQIRVSSARYNTLADKKKIELLVKRGYGQAAFKKRSNAEYFAKLWKKKGRKDIEGFRSTGPTVEEPGKASRSYYVTTTKPRIKRKRKRST